MPTLYEELKYISQFIDILDDLHKEKMRVVLFHRKSGVWNNLRDLQKIEFYERLLLPDKFKGKIYVAYILIANEIVTETKNNKEVPDTVIEWYRRN